jgi:hypothetical protein
MMKIVVLFLCMHLIFTTCKLKLFQYAKANLVFKLVYMEVVSLFLQTSVICMQTLNIMGTEEQWRFVLFVLAS